MSTEPLACSAPPKVRAKRGLLLLGDNVVELNVVARFCDVPSFERSKKQYQSAFEAPEGYPSEANAALVGAIEDGLKIYHRPREPERFAWTKRQSS